MRNTLTDPEQTAALLVTLPEEWPLTELAELCQVLKDDLRVSVAGVVVNQVWNAEQQKPEMRDTAPVQVQTAVEHAEEVWAVAQRQHQAVENALGGQGEATSSSSHESAVSTALRGQRYVSLPWLPESLEPPEVIAQLCRAFSQPSGDKRSPTV